MQKRQQKMQEERRKRIREEDINEVGFRIRKSLLNWNIIGFLYFPLSILVHKYLCVSVLMGDLTHEVVKEFANT